MCGLGGFAGIYNARTRYALVTALGMGIDERGGHAAGFVTVNSDGHLKSHKKLGHWLSAKEKFIRSAASGPLAMLHARFATCGKKTVQEAHPFAIQREGRTKLYGAHNGVVYNAWSSAVKHKREILVDSQEIFECIADGNIKALNDLDGYGVITWIDPSDPSHVKMTRLSSHADIYVAAVQGGGIVWGSTKDIVHDALQLADLKHKHHYDLKEVGQVWQLQADGVFKTTETGYKFDERPAFTSYGSKGWSKGGWDSWDSDEDWERWEAECADDEEQKRLEKKEQEVSDAWERMLADRSENEPTDEEEAREELFNRSFADM